MITSLRHSAQLAVLLALLLVLAPPAVFGQSAPSGLSATEVPDPRENTAASAHATTEQITLKWTPGTGLVSGTHIHVVEQVLGPNDFTRGDHYRRYSLAFDSGTASIPCWSL